MNIVKTFWVRLRDNIGAIIFLSIFQILITIGFPGHSFLGATANAIARPIFGVVGMISLIWLFTLSDRIEDGFIFNWASKFDEPLRTWLRNTLFLVADITLIFGIYFMYYNGFFNYSKSYYIIMGLYGFFLYYFLYLAVEKRKNNSTGPVDKDS